MECVRSYLTGSFSRSRRTVNPAPDMHFFDINCEIKY